MGRRNYLVEGISGAGKTSVCRELQRRGYHAINGDQELAYQGDPISGEPQKDGAGPAVHEHHIWQVDEVTALIADHRNLMTFFCGGSRNFPDFIDLFDEVFLLTIDHSTLLSRLDGRSVDEWGGPGRQAEREFIEHLHRTESDIPSTGVRIDASMPLSAVVDEILRRVEN